MWVKNSGNDFEKLQQGTSVLAACERGYDHYVVEQVYIDSLGWLHHEGNEHIDDELIIFWMLTPEPPNYIK